MLPLGIEHLTVLHQVPGLGRYLAPSVTCELEIQLFSGIVCGTTYRARTEPLFTPYTGEISSDPEPKCDKFPEVLRSMSMAGDADYCGWESDTAASQSSENWDDEAVTFPALYHTEQLDNLRYEGQVFNRFRTLSASMDAASSQVLVDEDSISAADYEETPVQEAKKEGVDFIYEVANSKKIFVNNINYRTKQQELWEFFKKFGQVRYCQVLKTQKGKSKGKGFVTFSSRDVVTAVLVAPTEELILHDRELSVAQANHRKPLHQPPGAEAADAAAAADPPVGAVCAVNRLKDDELVLIFRLLSLRQRFTCERVCKRWRQVALQVWRLQESLAFTGTLSRFGGISDYQMAAMLKRDCPALLALDVTIVARFLGDNTIRAISSCCPQLQSLNLSGMPITNNHCRTLATGCTNLQRLRMQRCLDAGEKGMWWIFHLCKELVSVNLDGMVRISGQCMHVLGHNVQEISLSGCSKLQDLAVEKIGTQSPQVQTLNISQCPLLTDQAFQHVAQHFQQLRVLHIAGVYSDVSETGLRVLGQLSGLEELHCNGNLAVDDLFLEALTRGQSQLRQMDLTMCTTVTTSGVSYLARCPHLTHLYLSGLRVHDVSLRSVIRGAAALQQLVLRGCFDITDHGLEGVADLCPQLHLLDLSSCDQITHQVALEFGEAHSNSFTLLGTYPPPITIVIGGTMILSPIPRDLVPPSVVLDVNDYSTHPLPRDYLPFFGDEDEEEEEDEEAEWMDGEFADYMDNDDPLNFEEMT